eukprot:TRINITY_DN5092_c0_g1_i2.p1 TRINITY_DN5092_c0_g1~~TRINITY_DN5092_c0_g1_i2.p1  ORF type:complete len:458 (-),score=77.65 TRINITY_DN5092_c0_g1_i2:42-1415(-)
MDEEILLIDQIRQYKQVLEKNGILPDLVPENDDNKAREHLNKEVINTERDYVSDLETMIEVYYEPLFVKGIISEVERDTLFANVTELLPLNKNKILARFEEILTQAEMNGIPISQVNFGDVFLELADHLRVYSEYCSNQPNALAELSRLRNENQDFASFVSDAMLKEERVKGLDINSYLIKPVQRLCKYPLLLREMIKLTKDTDVEYTKLQEAAQKLGVTVTEVNEIQRRAEAIKQQAIDRIIDIGDSIDGGEFLDLGGDRNRSLVRDGEVMRVIKNKLDSKIRKMWLFNNLLVIAVPFKKSKKGKDYKYEYSVHLKNCTPVDLGDMDDLSHLILIKDRSGELEEITLSCYDLQDKIGWIKTIRTKIKEYQKMEMMRIKNTKPNMTRPLRTMSTSQLQRRNSSTRKTNSVPGSRNIAQIYLNAFHSANILFGDELHVPGPPKDDNKDWEEIVCIVIS